MKRFLVAGILLLLAAPAFAAPFVICDSYVAPAVLPDAFRVSVDGAAEVVSLPFSGTTADGTVLANAVHFDVGSVAVGAHTVSVKACKDYGVWGVACSAASPFSFSKPAVTAPGILTGTSLKN